MPKSKVQIEKEYKKDSPFDIGTMYFIRPF